MNNERVMEGFESWFDHVWYSHDLDEGIGETRGCVHNTKVAWQAACEWMRQEMEKEVENLKSERDHYKACYDGLKPVK